MPLEQKFARLKLVLEAMKMQNELRAPKAGSIKSVDVQKGERVENGRMLIVLI